MATAPTRSSVQHLQAIHRQATSVIGTLCSTQALIFKACIIPQFSQFHQSERKRSVLVTGVKNGGCGLAEEAIVLADLSPFCRSDLTDILNRHLKPGVNFTMILGMVHGTMVLVVQALTFAQSSACQRFLHRGKL